MCLKNLKKLVLFRKTFVVVRSLTTTSFRESVMSNSSATTDVTEGRAKVILPQGVFYNPVQEFNRDLTVSVICAFQKLHERKWYDKKEELKIRATSKTPVNENFKSKLSIEYPGIKILEALAASGLRSTRFALEVPNVDEIIANDVDPAAAELIAVNIQSNGEETQRIIKSSCKDANLLLLEHRCRNDLFDAIDLDPYGSAAKFLSASMAAIADGGLLCVTCTDAAVLCGSTAGTAFGRYGGVSLRCGASHEVALRLLLHSLQHHAAVEGRYIEPLISLSVDFYLRVFVRVFRGPGQAKLAPSRCAILYLCSGCGAQHLQPLGRIETGPGDKVVVAPARGPVVGAKCEECGSAFNVAGPMWSERIHDAEFASQIVAGLRWPQNNASQAETPNPDNVSSEEVPLREVGEHSYYETLNLTGAFSKASLKTRDRIVGVLTLISEELSDCPLFYRADQLSKVVRCQVPSLMQLRSAILNAGFRVSSSHIDPMAFKTDASPRVLWDILRCWVKYHRPISKQHLDDPNSLSSRILAKEPTTEVDFNDHAEANPASRKEGLLRFQVNPEKDWGPKSRAKRGLGSGTLETMKEKRARLQGKRTVDEEPISEEKKC